MTHIYKYTSSKGHDSSFQPLS